MNHEQVLSVLVGPHTSEKTTEIAEKSNQYTFKVRNTATKQQIKKAVEKMFNVSVQSVTTLNIKGKRKRFAQRAGKRVDIKKAYVTLKDGDDLDFAIGE